MKMDKKCSLTINFNTILVMTLDSGLLFGATL